MKWYIRTVNGKYVGWVIAATEDEALDLAYKKYPAMEMYYVETRKI